MKWGILATGNIAQKFAFTLKQMEGEGEVLTAAGSRRAESAAAFGAAYGIPHTHGSYEALAADPEVEAVYIATPNSLHAADVRLCLEHGKHVLCEKPFTLTADQARELYALAAEKGLFLMEALWIRFLPLYAELRRMLAGGVIGEVRQGSCQYGFVAQGARRERKFRSELGGGALLDIGVYNLGFFQMALGIPDQVETQEVHFTEYGTDDYSRLCLRWRNGCEAQSVQAIGQELERRAVLEGTKGRIVLPDFQHAETMLLQSGAGEKELRFPFAINGFEYQIREVSRCVAEGRTASSLYPPEDSIALTALMEQIRTGWGMKFAGEP